MEVTFFVQLLWRKVTAMNRTIGDRLREFRSLKAWTQEQLASTSGVSVRTVQRIERGETPNAETLMALAAAFDVEVGQLKAGLTVADLTALRQAYSCASCGASLSARSFVPHEYGEAEFEEFECGSTRGWADRPCPADPQFPAFKDYDLHFVEGSDGAWSCFAVGRTHFARQVQLRDGRGQSREEAEAWVKYSYTAARNGSAAAEQDLCERLAKLQSLSDASRLSMGCWRRPA